MPNFLYALSIHYFNSQRVPENWYCFPYSKSEKTETQMYLRTNWLKKKIIGFKQIACTFSIHQLP